MRRWYLQSFVQYAVSFGLFFIAIGCLEKKESDQTLNVASSDGDNVLHSGGDGADGQGDSQGDGHGDGHSDGDGAGDDQSDSHGDGSGDDQSDSQGDGSSDGHSDGSGARKAVGASRPWCDV